MGNLVLGRGEGQSVRLTQTFFSPVTIEVVRITGGDCHFVVEQDGHEMFIKAKLLESVPTYLPEVSLVVAAIARGRAKLSFNAPLTVRIMRAELEIGCDE